jgi:ABC-2 type transport system ATP-binding protein
MPLIEAINLSKDYLVADKAPGFMGTLRHFFRRRYRAIAAVQDVTFSIETGEIVGFLGPNGAGKTTAIKMLTGLIHPTGGTARVDGRDPFKRHHDFITKITLVMGQKQQLMWDLPALDTMRVNAAVYQIDDKEYAQRVGELSEMLGLGQELRQPVRKLSLGERMKVELMAALLHRPQILFLDEPTLGLDINAQAAVREFLREYNQRYNATILLTSHYMADITALCNRVLLIHEGALMYDGALSGLIDRLAPHRQVNLEFDSPPSKESLSAYGEVESVDGNAASMLVPRDALTKVLDRLLSDFTIVDLTVTDPPIEKLIGQLFKHPAMSQGTIGSPMQTSS